MSPLWCKIKIYDDISLALISEYITDRGGEIENGVGFYIEPVYLGTINTQVTTN